MTFTGYNEVVRIPSGATNIDVRQHSYSGKPEDDNYLGKTQHTTFFVLLNSVLKELLSVFFIVFLYLHSYCFQLFLKQCAGENTSSLISVFSLCLPHELQT